MVTTIVACTNNDYPKFDPDFAALNIWVGSSSSQYDSVTYNYSYSMGLDSVMFYARIAGVTTDTARTFELEAYDGDLEEAEGSYYFGDYVFEAGEYNKTFYIYFNKFNLKDDSSFVNVNGNLYIRLKENEAFVTGAEDMQEIHIVLKNYLAKPDTWDNATYPYNSISRYFGSYSETKYRFMIQELGLVDFKIRSNTSTSYNETTNEISTIYASYLSQVMKLALEEYNSNPDNDPPMRDEFGEIVTF